MSSFIKFFRNFCFGKDFETHRWSFLGGVFFSFLVSVIEPLPLDEKMFQGLSFVDFLEMGFFMFNFYGLICFLFSFFVLFFGKKALWLEKAVVPIFLGVVFGSALVYTFSLVFIGFPATLIFMPTTLVSILLAFFCALVLSDYGLKFLEKRRGKDESS